MVTSWTFAFFMAFAGVSGTVGATTLTEAQLAKHDHPEGGGPKSGIGYNGGGWGGWATGGDSIDTGIAGGSQSHTHSLSGVKSGSASSLPPYYALAYIMRIA